MEHLAISWCKYFHGCQFEAINMASLNVNLERCPWNGASSLQHIPLGVCLTVCDLGEGKGHLCLVDPCMSPQ